MTPLQFYAQKWDRPANNNFAVACYNSNSHDALASALLQESPDSFDCATWSISPAEWRDAIRAALAQKTIELSQKGE
jgi:hypothetical protein